MKILLFRSAAVAVVLAACGGGPDSGGESADEAATAASAYHVRYLAMNIGNFALTCSAYENKLCTPDVSDRIRDYILTWKPDVIMISEVLDEPQLTRTLYESDIEKDGDAGKNLGGPILPSVPAIPYVVSCHPSVDRDTGRIDSTYVMDNPSASHRHECIVYNAKKFALLSAGTAYGPNATAWDKANCHFDFTGRAADLKFLGGKDKNGEDIVITAIAVHPPSNPNDAAQKTCRKDEIRRYWSDLAAGKKRVIIGGDWNTQEDDELQVPSGFYVNYSKGQHFAFATHDEYSAQYYFPLGKWQFDHAFTNFGKPCTDCGKYYRGASQDLPFGAMLGDYDGHPWAAHPGLDHRQLLVDLTF